MPKNASKTARMINLLTLVYQRDKIIDEHPEYKKNEKREWPVLWRNEVIARMQSDGVDKALESIDEFSAWNGKHFEDYRYTIYHTGQSRIAVEKRRCGLKRRFMVLQDGELPRHRYGLEK